MCGIFGYVASGNKGPNVQRLREMAIATERRGPHAFGWAWLDAAGRLRHYKQPGRITDHLELLADLAAARIVIGHCRWATAGDPANNLNNHPFACDGGFIIHNGVIHDAGKIARAHALRTVTECDSEILARLIEEADAGGLLARCTEAVDAVDVASPLVMAGLWKPGRLVLVRRGNPLHLAATSRGLYFASLADGLPTGAEMMGDGTAREYRWPPRTLAHKHGKAAMPCGI